jgi:hypothetical protein
MPCQQTRPKFGGLEPVGNHSRNKSSGPQALGLVRDIKKTIIFERITSDRRTGDLLINRSPIRFRVHCPGSIRRIIGVLTLANFRKPSLTNDGFISL